MKLNIYKNVLQKLHEAIEETNSVKCSIRRDGTIHRFELTTELAWKTIREYLLAMEVSDINSPRAVMKEAFSNDIITEEEKWIQILRDRNSTSHIYDQEEADEIYSRIANEHIILFDALLETLMSKIIQ